MRGGIRGGGTLTPMLVEYFLGLLACVEAGAVTLIRGPRLKRGRVTGHGCEVAVMQPIDHGVFLLQTGVALPVVLT